MANLRQSFSWWCFQGKGVEAPRLLSETKAMGYAGVDLIDEKLWPSVVDAGLQLVAQNGHATLDDGLNKTANADRIEKELRVNIEKAAQWKIPVLICFSGRRNGLNDEAGLAACASTLARVAPAAEQAGVKLAMELLNSKVDHKDYQCDRTAWGIQLCERVGSPAVGLLYDIYHMQIMEGDLIRTIQRDHRHFVHYHTAGNPGRGPMNVEQEIQYAPIYRAIAGTGYQGWIGHEFIPKGDPLTELRAAYDQCAEA